MRRNRILWEGDTESFRDLRASLTGIQFQDSIYSYFKGTLMIVLCRLDHRFCRHPASSPCLVPDILFIIRRATGDLVYRWQGHSGRIEPELPLTVAETVLKVDGPPDMEP